MGAFSSLSRFDRWIITLIFALGPLAGLLSYSQARMWILFPLPLGLFGFFLCLAALVFLGSSWDTSALKPWFRRLLSLVLALYSFIGVGPLSGYGWDLGLRHHVQSVSDPEVIQAFREATIANRWPEDGTGMIDVAKANFPSLIGKSRWGLPGFAKTETTAKGSHYLELWWGGALVGHHGLVVTDEPIPENGTSRDGVTSPYRYFPWLEGSYIVFFDD